MLPFLRIISKNIIRSNYSRGYYSLPRNQYILFNEFYPNGITMLK